jgi:hypothetical protein
MKMLVFAIEFAIKVSADDRIRAGKPARGGEISAVGGRL